MQTRKYRKSTITDVASAAGGSVSTVSAYIRGRQSVCSPETADRILKAIADFHYSPAPATRGSRDRSTNTIGSTLRDPASYDSIADIMFHFRLRIGVNDVMHDRGLALLTYPRFTNNPVDCSSLLDGRIDGVLFVAELTDARPAQIARAGLPIVVFERYKTIPEGCGAARASELDVVQLALDHLWGLGHRKIAHVSGAIKVTSADRFVLGEPHDFAIWRHRHYVDFMNDHGVYDPHLVHVGEGWSMSESEAESVVAGWQHLDDPPTAVFCANDRIAFAIMKAARARGLKIPEDLSVVGVDNEPSADSAGLTTVDIPLEAVGRAGTLALFDLMAGTPATECRPLIAVQDLVVRQTTAPPRIGRS